MNEPKITHEQARKWVEGVTATLPSWRRDLLRYVDQQESKEAAGPAWVDCRERMPDPYDVVQFLTHGGDVCVGPRRPPFGRADDAWWEDMTDVDAACECSRYDDEQVTHWAPLLTAPPSKPEGS